MRFRAAFTYAIILCSTTVGCGGNGPAVSSPEKPSDGPTTRGKIAFIGFDASPPLVTALKANKILGLVVQNPLVMGETGVRTLVDHLEKRDVERQVDTGETMVTPDNLNDPAVAALLDPPKAENVTGGRLSGSRDKKWKVMVIPKGTTHEFWRTIHAGALKAAESLGNVEVVWQGPQKEDDRVQQIELVQSAIAAKVDGIVLAPLDSRALVKPVEEAIGKGIPVVIIDSGLDSNKIVSYVATNNYNGGALAARRLGGLLNGEGRIILLRYAQGSASTIERENGFTETIAKEYPKITYLSDGEYAGATSDTAQQKSQSLVTRYRGQIDGIFCVNESSTLGMLRALEGAGLLSDRR